MGKSRPLLIEVISEGPHCVPCEYAIAAVEYVCESFTGLVEVRVIETRNPSDAKRYLDLSRGYGKLLPMPSVCIEGHVVCGDIPEPDELRNAIERYLAPAETIP